MVDFAPGRNAHFASNIYGWAIVHHFLPATLMREFCQALVFKCTDGKTSFADLFDDLIVGSRELSSWLISPSQVSQPLQRYLQVWIRNFVWQNDSEAFLPEKLREIDALKQLDVALRLGRKDFSSPIKVSEFSMLPELAAGQFLSAFQYASSSVGKVDRSVVEQLLSGVTNPLKALHLKHIGDLLADSDDWIGALSLYRSSSEQVEEIDPELWPELVIVLRSAVRLSCLSAERVLDGPSEVASQFNKASIELQSEPLFALNSAQDALVARMLSSANFEFDDTRATALILPTVLATHDNAVAMRQWMEERFETATERFWATLRRQIALGAAEQSRDTKASFAEALFEFLALNSSRQHESVFWLALRLLLESGKGKLAGSIKWDRELVQRLLSKDLLNKAIAHATKYDGVSLERVIVLNECFGAWAALLPRDQGDIAAIMIDHLVDGASSRERKPLSTDTVGNLCLKLLRKIAEVRPEFTSLASQRLTKVLLEYLRNQASWRETEQVLELAGIALPLFDDDQRTQVFDAVIDVLSKLNPDTDLWPVTRPAIQMLMSDLAVEASRKNSDLRNRIVDTILRTGLSNRSEWARLLFFLQDTSFDDEKWISMQQSLLPIIESVADQAQKTNASNSIYNANALLYAPRVVGGQKVRVGLSAVRSIIEAGLQGPRPGPSFADVYSSLLLLSARRKIILEQTSISKKEMEETLAQLFQSAATVWGVAAAQPALFAGFSIPPRNHAHPIIVYNFALSFIRFGISLDRYDEVKAILDSARSTPELRVGIDKAFALSGSELTAEYLSAESKEAFYSAVGERLMRVRTSSDKREVMDAMVQKCLLEGPHSLDAAVFAFAVEAGCTYSGDDTSLVHYRMRLDNQSDLRDLRSSLNPILRALIRSGD